MADKTCKKCDRPLIEGERALCPSCRSERRALWKRRWDNTKKIGGAVLAIIAVGGPIVREILRKGKRES
jgi:hypothetical protein